MQSTFVAQAIEPLQNEYHNSHKALVFSMPLTQHKRVAARPSAAFDNSVTFALPLLEETVVSGTLAARINTLKTTARCLHVDGAATAVVENGKWRSSSMGFA